MSEKDRANRLYWESEASVNDIADRMDLSKSMLYGLIEPLAADAPCPDCGSVLVYPNRTALDRGLMQCEACGREGVTDEDVDPEASLPVSEEGDDADEPAVWHPGDGSFSSYEPRDPVADRQAMLGAGLLGAAALLWLMRRT